MTWAIPAAAGGLQAYGTLSGASDDASAMQEQARVARAQALQDEYAQRRAGRQNFGRLAAAMAQNGGGVDEGLLRQSSLNSELDALATRYAGAMKGYTLESEASSLKRRSKLMAGAQLLSGASQSYAAYKLPR